MENISIVEILKVGLPGLVFLLSWLSYRLLNKEQCKEKPKISILKAIKNFMYVNVVLAILTATSPLFEYFMAQENLQVKAFNIQAQAGDVNLPSGTAEVCHDVDYAKRWLLVSNGTNKLTQVFSKTLIPCSTGERKIILSKQQITELGWSDNTTNYNVQIVVAPLGYKFDIANGI